MLQNILKYSRIFGNIIEYSRIFWNNWKVVPERYYKPQVIVKSCLGTPPSQAKLAHYQSQTVHWVVFGAKNSSHMVDFFLPVGNEFDPLFYTIS